MPARVSVASATMRTNQLPLSVYSFRKMAAPMPNTEEQLTESAITISVFSSAGMNEQLSELYSSENISGLIWGMPITRM